MEASASAPPVLGAPGGSLTAGRKALFAVACVVAGFLPLSAG